MGFRETSDEGHHCSLVALASVPVPTPEHQEEYLSGAFEDNLSKSLEENLSGSLEATCRAIQTRIATSHALCGSEAGSYFRLIDSSLTQLKARGPAQTCNESKEEEALCQKREQGSCPTLFRHENNQTTQKVECLVRKVDARLSGKEISRSHGVKPVHLIITVIKWIRTSRLS